MVGVGIVLSVLLVSAIGAVYRGSIWLATDRRSPARAAGRQLRITRVVRRESADLDKQYAELVSSEAAS